MSSVGRQLASLTSRRPGLALRCRREGELGHLVRTAIHPDQVETIERSYLPSVEEVDIGHASFSRLATDGAGTVGEGEFVDVTMLAGAARRETPRQSATPHYAASRYSWRLVGLSGEAPRSLPRAAG